MTEATTPARMDENGRITVPKPVREKLGVDGEQVLVDVTVSYEGDEEDADE